MPLDRAARAIKGKVEEGQQEQLKQGLDATRIKNQLPGRVLPPGGPAGNGYPSAPHTHPLDDITQSGATDGQVPIWSDDDDAWVPGDITGTGSLTITDGVTTVSGVTDLTIDGGTVDDDGGGAATLHLTGGPGGTPSHAYYDYLCAQLEPLALEPLFVGTGSIAVGSGATKFVILGWDLQTAGGGRIDIRDPRDPLPLRNITLSGIGSTSHAVILDPSLASYADSWTTYHDRLQSIAELPTKIIEANAAATFYPFLPGAYGAIITGNTVFNLAWLGLYSTAGGGSIVIPLNFELGDATTDWVRFGQSMRVPITKAHACGIYTGNAGGIGAALGSLTYVLLPSTWGAVADPLSYLFRDDFMGATLDTATVWTRAQSSAGNVEIKPNFQWLGMIGSGSWGANGLYNQANISRAAGKVLLVDVFVSNANPNLYVGWSDGLGQADSNFAHAIDFSGGGLYVFENGNNRGSTGSGFTAPNTYRLRITLGASNATYAIQGGPEYPAIGGASWTTLTPGTPSSSTTTPLHAGATIHSAQQCFLGDMRVYA
jgi:hypothetical protein